MLLSVYKNSQLVGDFDLGKLLQERAGSESMEFTLGRSDDCHVILSDQQISRHHASVIFEEGKWRVERKSNFGNLILNGMSCDNSNLKNGDVLLVGPFQVNVSQISVVADDAATTEQVIKEESIETKQESDDATELISETESEELVEGDEVTEVVEGASSEFEEMTLGGEESDSNDLSDPDSTGEFDISAESEDEDVVENELNAESEESEEESFGDDGFGDDGFNDDGFSDDAFGDDGFGGGELTEVSDDGGAATQILSNFATYELLIEGEYAPYDRFIVEQETKVGRDPEECQIILNDSEVSSVHAIIRKTFTSCVVEDQNSSNGTLLNGERINKVELKHDDVFTIGSTSFTLKVHSELIHDESNQLMPVESGQEITVEEIVEEEVEFDGEDFEFGEGVEGGEFGTEEQAAAPQGLKAKWDALNPRQKLIYGGVIIGAIWMLLGGEDSKPKKSAKKGKKTHKLAKEKDNKKDQKGKSAVKKKLTPEEIEFAEQSYQLARAKIAEGNYREAKNAANAVQSVDPSYKDINQLVALIEEGFKEIEELERKEREKIEKEKRRKKVEGLVTEARKAVDEKKATVAEALFGQIMQLDPENLKVPQMKMELDAWKKEKERVALEKAQKEAERKRMVEAITPGRNLYLKKEWYDAIGELEKFLKITKMDEDLIKEGSKMLSESRENLEAMVSPLLGKARSLREGQDLKGSYQVYSEILNIHPIHTESLNEMNQIREILERRSRRIYREGLISESLSLFDDAKEKFQEVQQISPTDSEYYEKATAKLGDYWD